MFATPVLASMLPKIALVSRIATPHHATASLPQALHWSSVALPCHEKPSMVASFCKQTPTKTNPRQAFLFAQFSPTAFTQTRPSLGPAHPRPLPAAPSRLARPRLARPQMGPQHPGWQQRVQGQYWRQQPQSRPTAAGLGKGLSCPARIRLQSMTRQKTRGWTEVGENARY